MAQKHNIILFDIGAYDGTFTMGWKKSYPDAQIYCFEPCKKTYDILKTNTSSLKNIKLYNKAISSQNGKQIFNECNYFECSSLLPIIPEASSKWKVPDQCQLISNTNTYM